MSYTQLWDTVLNPENRTLKRISIKEMVGEESFWVYEFLEWAEWNIVE
jgi:DNA gyrase/topoisomerase IV subunit B